MHLFCANDRRCARYLDAGNTARLVMRYERTYMGGMHPSDGKEWHVAALYRFANIADPQVLRQTLQPFCRELGLCGTLLVAHEGINGTLAGSEDAIARIVERLRQIPGMEGLDPKFSQASEKPFLRMKVRVKREIVTMGVNGIDAASAKGRYIPPQEWNSLVDQPDTVMIDTRNEYEVSVGSFDGALDPKTRSFSDFPAWFDSIANSLKKDGATPRVAMFCTGGIRCEKATAYVKSRGFEEVFHLEGGILKYLETVPAEENRFQGDCFVFDQRVAVGHGLAESGLAMCHACRMPLTPQDCAEPDYIEGVQCPHCAATRTDEQRERYRERQRQVEMARTKGRDHLAPEDDQV